MRKVNIHGTAIITNLSIDAKIDKICFVGSIASIGKSLDGTLITEECEWNSQEHNSDYSITKFGAEIEIWRASQEGVDVVIVNPGIILGSGFWEKGSSKLFTQVSKGLKYFTGNKPEEFKDVYQLDNYVVTEKGNKTIIREVDQDGDMLYKENQMEIDYDPETGSYTYNEASARPDAEGKLKDVEEYIEEDDLENMRKYTYDE